MDVYGNMTILLNSIDIDDLFGFQPVNIPDISENVASYILAKNGLGKTTTLKIIDIAGNRRWAWLLNHEFKKIRYEFVRTNGKKFELTFTNKSNDILMSIADTDNPASYSLKNCLNVQYHQLAGNKEKADWIANQSQDVSLANCGKHWKTPHRHHLREQELINIKEPELGLKAQVDHPNILAKVDSLLNGWKTSYIGTNRLRSSLLFGGSARDREYDTPSQRIKEVIQLKNAEHFSDAYQETLKLGNEFFNDAIQNFENKENYEFSIETVKANILKLNELEKNIANFHIREEEEGEYVPLLDPPNDLQNDIGALLEKFVEVRLSELASHERFFETNAIFEEFLNESFSDKKVKIQDKDGFVLTHNWTNDVDDFELSSGEQHLLALSFLILYEIPENSLILIDEPEISMHLTWLYKLNGLLERVHKTRNMRFLCATHAHAIVDDKYHLQRPINPRELPDGN